MSTDLDPVIHQRVRLGIVGMLNPAEKVHFKMLRDHLGLSDSSLSQHLTTLEDAGYVKIEKLPVGRRTATWVSLTRKGRAALSSYVTALERVLNPQYE